MQIKISGLDMKTKYFDSRKKAENFCNFLVEKGNFTISLIQLGLCIFQVNYQYHKNLDYYLNEY